jgi:gamma-glutamyltranspeptidase/glutathione hydrolase
MVVGDGDGVYRPGGRFLQAGERLQHPDHVHAYDLLAEDPEAFYRGDYAAAMVAACADSSALDAADLAAYRVRESAPRQAAFGGYTVLARGDDLDDVLATMASAAIWLRGGRDADPRTDPGTARGLVTALRGVDRRTETTNLCAVDRSGNACVITTSLGLGSGVWVPGFGVHLNSMLGEGELIRKVPVPGTRLGSMMSPLVAVDAEQRPVVAAGAAGGSRIRPALVQSVLRMLNGEDPQSAIDQPRLNALPGLVRLEPGFSATVIEALRRTGDEVVEAASRDPYFGGVSALGSGGGGADPRRSGAVLLLG